jgi:hypothetical protein
MKSRRVKWAGHVARMGERNGAYKVLVGKRRERDYLKNPGLVRRIILKCIFRKWDGDSWTGLIWLSAATCLGTDGGHF